MRVKSKGYEPLRVKSKGNGGIHYNGHATVRVLGARSTTANQVLRRPTNKTALRSLEVCLENTPTRPNSAEVPGSWRILGEGLGLGRRV